MEFLAVPFLAVGIVAVIVRFVAPVGPPRLPDVIDRSIGMYVIRRFRGTLDLEMPPDDDAETVSGANRTGPSQGAPPDHGRDLRATPARLAAVGVVRAAPIRRPVARARVPLAPRSMPATRLAAVPGRPLWRRVLTRRRPSRPAPTAWAWTATVPQRVSSRGTIDQRRPLPRMSGRAGPAAAALTLILVALVAAAAFVRQP